MKSLGVFSNGGYSDYLMLPHPRYLIDIGDLPAEPARGRRSPARASPPTAPLKKGRFPTLTTEAPLSSLALGALGLMCIAIHKAMGGKERHRSSTIDPKEARRGAKAAGAEACVRRRQRPDARRADRCGKPMGGAWAVIDLVGSSATAAAGHRQPDQGRQVTSSSAFTAATSTLSLPPFPDARHHHPGLLCRQACRKDAGADRARPPHRPAAGAGRDASRSTIVNAVLGDLRAGKIVGRRRADAGS